MVWIMGPPEGEEQRTRYDFLTRSSLPLFKAAFVMGTGSLDIRAEESNNNKEIETASRGSHMKHPSTPKIAYWGAAIA